MTYSDKLVILAEIKKLGYEPNAYEKTFLESIEKRYYMTPGQERLLQDIYAKAAGAGVFVRRQYFKR
jgi:hypothetical protein